MTTVLECLKNTTGRLLSLTETPELEAQVLLASAMQQPRTWLLAHPEEPLNSRILASLEGLVERRTHGEPLPYIIGEWEFFNLNFDVNPAVLIPRPETELLVERAISWLQNRKPVHGNYNILDVGTGCGCIAIALAVNISNDLVFATDISPDSLEIAQRNAVKYGVQQRVTFILADLIPLADEQRMTGQVDPLTAQAIPLGFDLIVANLPYIPTSVLNDLGVSKHEPRLALDGGEDGLSLIRRLLALAPPRLTPGGLILLEIESSQGPSALSLAYDAFTQAEIHLHQDLAGRDRLLEIRL